MSPIPYVATVSGLLGALFSAYLSYFVRLRAKAREDADERRRLAHVNYLQLTDLVASSQYIKQFVDRVAKTYNVNLEGFGLSHAAAVFFGERLSQIHAEERMALRVIAKRIVAILGDDSIKLEIRPSDLGRMNDVTIYTYNRFQMASVRFKHALAHLGTYLELDAWNGGELTSALHALFSAYGKLTDAAGVLRAALQSMAGLSADYAFKCLKRSYTAAHQDVASSIEHAPKLELAKKAAQAANEAATGAVDVPAQNSSSVEPSTTTSLAIG